MKESPQIEKLAADHILAKGVPMKMRAPFFLRWLGKRTFSLLVRSPYEGTLHKVASYYLSTGITSDELTDLTIEQAVQLMVRHGNVISKAVACAWLNSYLGCMILTKPLAWYIRWHAKPIEVLTIMNMVVLYGGTSDFMDTTRLVRTMKVTSRMGQKTQGS